MIFSNLWAKITKKDIKKKFPMQECLSVGQPVELTIVFPYGLYCDLPNNALVKKICEKSAVPFTIDRPDDLQTGEPSYFHPLTNTRIVCRNNGDLEITTDDGNSTGNVIINCLEAQINASTSVTIDTPQTNITGNVQIDGNLNVDGATSLSSTVTSNGKDISDTHTHAGSPTAPAGAISPTGTPN